MKLPLFGKGQQTKHVKENEILLADLTTAAWGKTQRCWKLAP